MDMTILYKMMAGEDEALHNLVEAFASRYAPDAETRLDFINTDMYDALWAFVSFERENAFKVGFSSAVGLITSGLKNR